VIVVDASVLASALGDDGGDGERARRRLAGERLFAPELVDLEVASVWRRAARAGRLGPKRADQALTDLAALPLARAPHQPLMSRIWELRDNHTPYDASYVALAEALETSLLTADRRLAQAPGARCKVELLG
jgi:predicted nucleic acid-binding protein